MLNIEKNLTPRLNMIAALVPPSATVCDIGTDHGYVAIYLAKKEVANKIIAADIKKGPLLQAEKNIALFEVSDKIETRLSDGFSAILPGEADTCIIAGMGGETIASILTNEKGCENFVLQMQTGHAHLRSYLCDNGFVIEKEALCKEGRKMYTALLAKRGKSPALTAIQKEIGPYLIEKRPPLFKDYIRYRLYEIECILKNISLAQDAHERKQQCLYLKCEYEKLLEA